MSQQLYSLSLDAIKYICNLINQTVDLPSTILDDLHLATNTTYSSYKLDTLLKALKEENIEYCDAAIAGLNKLSKEIITDKSQITNENTIYLLLTDASKNIYEQWLLINGTPTMIGTTEMNLDNVYTKDEADARYALLTDLKTLSDEVAGIKTKIGTETLTTTATTLTGAINEVANKSTIVSLTKAEYDALTTKDPETYYIITDDEQSVVVSNVIDSASTNDEIPSAKAVFDALKNDKTIGIDYTYENSNSLNINLTKAGLYKIFSPTEGVPEGNPQDYTLLNIPWRDSSTKMKFGYQMLFTPRCAYYWVRTVWNYDPSTYTYTEGDYSVFRKWQKVCTTSVADVPKTVISSFNDETNYKVPSSTSRSYYVVKNGLCTLSIDIDAVSSTNAPINVYQVPKPIGNVFRNVGAYRQTSTTTKPLYIDVTPTGQLNLWDGTDGENYMDTFTYPVAES